MSATTIIETIAAQQGWNDETMLELCLGYIEHQGSNDAFGDYLRGVAAEENAATDDSAAPENIAALNNVLASIGPAGGVLSCAIDRSDEPPVVYIEQVEVVGDVSALEKNPEDALGAAGYVQVMDLLNRLYGDGSEPIAEFVRGAKYVEYRWEASKSEGDADRCPACQVVEHEVCGDSFTTCSCCRETLNT